MDYHRFAFELTASGILSDPWLEGRPRFRREPLVLSRAQADLLGGAAEALAAAYDQLVQLCVADGELVDRFFGLTPFQRLMWQASAPQWHGIARADVFLTDEGPRICELNCDTPSGEAEAILLNATALRSATAPATLPAGLVDPNRDLGARLCDAVAALGERVTPGPLTVGIIYPTELTEDLSMIALYRRWFAGRGWRVELGSPYNLRRHDERRAALFDVPCDVFVRHYKTDWWGERQPVWDDETFADPEPLAEPLRVLLGSLLAGGCAVLNPFGAVVPQNKRAMALMWEEIARFPSWAQQAIRRYLPFTARLETLAPAQLAAEQSQWVLKSDYGCEGAEVVIGAHVSAEEWRLALAHVVPRRWVAQRYFRDVTDERGESINYGVYLVAGVVAGWFSRLSRGVTDHHAVAVPTLIADKDDLTRSDRP